MRTSDQGKVGPEKQVEDAANDVGKTHKFASTDKPDCTGSLSAFVTASQPGQLR